MTQSQEPRFENFSGDVPAFMEAVRVYCEHMFDVDETEFVERFGVTLEEAKARNGSFTGKSSFHACTSLPCIDSMDALFAGAKGKVCWCDCHPWNKPPPKP